MSYITGLIDFILHIDKHLAQVTQDYGAWAYGILFLIVFCETGLVVTPFLPGDSLLFAAGALAGAGLFDVNLLALLLLLLPQVLYITCAQAPCPACIPLHLPQWQQARHAKSYWDLSFHRYWRCLQIIALHFELQLSRTSN
jgi:hypothetical protein